MKLALLFLFAMSSAWATVDGQTIVYLVTENPQVETYDIVGYQYTGCYGIAYGPQSVAFTSPFYVDAPRGCGGPEYKEDVNALSCADSTVKYYEEGIYIESVVIDLSKCSQNKRNSAEFRILAKKAAEKNFHTLNVTVTQ